ncbi:MAG: winged helix-turn-helix domain-containing protein, partial [Dehalococcoidia bacterium]
MVSVGDLLIDRERYLVTVCGTPVRLTYMEFNALWAIVEEDGRVVTYERLAERLWGETTTRSRNRLAVIISRVRSKLGREGAVIDTVVRV